MFTRAAHDRAPAVVTVTPGTSAIPLDAPSTRNLPRLFSNRTRCASCRRVSEIRVHYSPGCAEVSGDHVHRWCPCGATWLERSAGHGLVDLNNPSHVLLCQNCRTRIPTEKAMNPRCCRQPEVGSHATRDPCELCRDQV
jgi:hypothetical protein